MRETIGGSYAQILSRIQNARSTMVDRKKGFTDASNSVEVLENKIQESKNAINVETFAEQLKTVKSKFKDKDFS